MRLPKTVWGGIIIGGKTDWVIDNAVRSMGGKRESNKVFQVPKYRKRFWFNKSFRKMSFAKNFGFNLFDKLRIGHGTRI